MSKYGKKIYQDRRWKTAREIVLKRSKGYCEKCKRLSSYLEIHHIVPLKYKSIKEPEDDDFNPIRLEALCRSCHFEITGRMNKRKKTKEEMEWDAYVNELK